LCDKSLRNKSYKKENETQKVKQYFECFNSLSSDCLDKINFYNKNDSLPNYYNTTNDHLYCNYYKYRFHLSVEAVSYENCFYKLISFDLLLFLLKITNKCLFGDMKIKDFYSSQLIDGLRKVVVNIIIDN